MLVLLLICALPDYPHTLAVAAVMQCQTEEILSQSNRLLIIVNIRREISLLYVQYQRT